MVHTVEYNRTVRLPADPAGLEGSADIVPKGRQIPVSRLAGRGGGLLLPGRVNTSCNLSYQDWPFAFSSFYIITAEADTPEFCYLLTSCSKRITQNLLCTVGENNLLDVRYLCETTLPLLTNWMDCRLFSPTLAACRTACEETEGCRYYYHYPISYSPAPLYCYLFRQCASKDDEPAAALVLGGRHPGHGFMDTMGPEQAEFTDLVARGAVCPLPVRQNEVEVSRKSLSMCMACVLRLLTILYYVLSCR